MITKVNAIKCKKCNDIVYSRARHDFRLCSCESVAIDGGFDYCKISANPGEYELIELEVNASKKQLFDDWSETVGKFGLIKFKK